MAQLHPYIHFNGNAEEAFTFYKSVFGGEFAKVARYKDLSCEQYPIPESDADRIMHIALPISQTSVLMGSDTMTSMGQVSESDNRNSISISADSKQEADRLFSGLAASGNIEMPIADAPWGNYFGMVTDQFGVQWMVDFSGGVKD